MKKFILICVLIVSLLTACISAEYTNSSLNQETDSLIEGYEINNEPIETADTRYSLEKLKSFFSNRSVIGSSPDQYPVLRLDEIDQKLPVVYLRQIQNDEGFLFYYIVYPVSEGGNFLVLLSESVDPTSRERNLCCWSTFYTHELPDKDRFAELEAGASLDDVMQIAPYTEMAIMSSADISYSLLRDGSAIKCTYARTTDESLILESTELLALDDPQNPYAVMLDSDLIA